MPYSIQTRRVWEALRSALAIAPGPADTANIDPSIVSPTWDISQGGHVNLQPFVGATSAISINGAALNFPLSTGTFLTSQGERPGTNVPRRLMGGSVTLSGAANRIYIILADISANSYIVWTSEIPANGRVNFPSILFAPGLEVTFSSNIGGAGETMTLYMYFLHAADGERVAI